MQVWKKWQKWKFETAALKQQATTTVSWAVEKRICDMCQQHNFTYTASPGLAVLLGSGKYFCLWG